MSVAASPKHSTARGRPSTVLHAAYRPPPEQPTLRGMGGGTGGVYRGVAQERHSTSPIPPSKNHTKNMTGGESRGHVTLRCEWRSNYLTVAASPKHGNARRLSTPPPPKNQAFVEWGGDRGCLQWHCHRPWYIGGKSSR